MTDSDQELWDRRYAGRAAFSGDPNPWLVDLASSLEPGRALDLGSGEGADAIWLAGRGWTVTGVDISPVALRRAAINAYDAGGRLACRTRWLHRNLATWLPPAGAFDLVAMHFLHLPPARFLPLFRRAAAAVAPGGILLVVGHHPSDLDTGVPRPPDAGTLFTPEDLHGSLRPDQWNVQACEVRPREVEHPAGGTVTVHDTVLHAERLLEP